MRAQLEVWCPYGRDVSWITQEVIEDFAGACIMGGAAPENCARKWSGGDPVRAIMLPELLLPMPEFRRLKDDLIAEFGEEYFLGAMQSKFYHIRQLEMSLESETDNDLKAKLYKVLLELRGWVTKPSDMRPNEVNNTLNVLLASGNKQIDNYDSKQLENLYFSQLG